VGAPHGERLPSIPADGPVPWLSGYSACQDMALYPGRACWHMTPHTSASRCVAADMRTLLGVALPQNQGTRTAAAAAQHA